MEFDWSQADVTYRSEFRQFLDEVLPEDWAEISKHGPGSDTQARFSKVFCGAMAQKGWLTQHWPEAYGGKDADPWRHAIVVLIRKSLC